MILKVILLILLTLLGYPIGLLLAKLTKEELKPGRKYFKIILLFCLLGIILSLIFLNGNNLFFLIIIFIFIFLMTLACLIKSRR